MVNNSVEGHFFGTPVFVFTACDTSNGDQKMVNNSVEGHFFGTPVFVFTACDTSNGDQKMVNNLVEGHFFGTSCTTKGLGRYKRQRRDSMRSSRWVSMSWCWKFVRCGCRLNRTNSSSADTASLCCRLENAQQTLRTLQYLANTKHAKKSSVRYC